MQKKKIVTILIVVATVILAGIAVFTAVRLFQLRQQAVAPTAPERPLAGDCGPDVCNNPNLIQVGCEADGTKDEQLCSAASHVQCREEICAGQKYYCVPSGSGFAWNRDDGGLCQEEAPNTQSCDPLTINYGSSSESTGSPTPTTSPTTTPTSTPLGGGPTEAPTTAPTATPDALPDAGIATPTLVGAGAGILLILLSLMLAL